MARKIIWSREALSDIEDIAEYIGRSSYFYARSFTEEVLDAGRSLETFSERGHIVPEIGKSSLRELIVKNYRLIYGIEKKSVMILAVVHGARDLEKLVKGKKYNV